MATGLRYILHRIDSLLNLLGVHFPTDTKAKHLQGHSITPSVSCFMVVEHVCVCMHAIVNAFGLLSYLIFCKNVPRAANVSWDTTGTDKAEKVFYKPINDSFCRCAMVGKEKSVP